MKHLQLRCASLALLATLVLAACGGNDDSVDMPTAADDPTRVPASALASPAALSAYVGGLPASDTDDPLIVTGLMPPVSDSDEPSLVR